jgi:hypothetical protein
MTYFPDIALRSILWRKKAAPLKFSIGRKNLLVVVMNKAGLLENTTRFAIVSGIISVLLSSLLAAVPQLASGFDVHMAVLAPIVACICISDSFHGTVRKCLTNFIGILCGGLVSLLWIFIFHAVSNRLSNPTTYNEYYLVLLTSPWLFSFFVFLPRRYVSVSCAVMVLTTDVVYSGDGGTAVVSPLFSILSGFIGCLISVLVGSVLAIIFRSKSTRFASFESREFRTALLSYWDSLVDGLVAPEGFIETAHLRRECIPLLVDKFTTIADPNALECFRIACILEEWVLYRKSIRIGPNSDMMALKSNRWSDALPSNIPTEIESVYRDFQISLSRLSGVTRRPLFGPSIIQARPPIWTCVRDTVILTGLSLLLVLWDARDTSVNTYAIWALVPAIIISQERLPSVVGFACVFGALLGGLVATACLLVNGEDRLGYIAELVLVLMLGVGADVHFARIVDPMGKIFIISWIATLMGNLGVDKVGDPDLWRVGLYRTCIAGLGVFVVTFGKILSEWRVDIVGDTVKEQVEKIGRYIGGERIDDFPKNFASILPRLELHAKITHSRASTLPLESLFAQALAVNRLVASSPIWEELNRVSWSNYPKHSSIRKLAREMKEAEKESIEKFVTLRFVKKWLIIEDWLGITEGDTGITEITV